MLNVLIFVLGVAALIGGIFGVAKNSFIVTLRPFNSDFYSSISGFPFTTAKPLGVGV